MSQNDMPHEEDAAADLNEALGGSETEFVAVEEKPSGGKVAAMGGLILIGIVALYFVYFKKGPAPAAASPEAVAADATISEFLSDNQRSMALMDEMRRNTEQVVQRFLTYPSTTQIPLSDLQTNPFRLREDAPDNANLSEAAARRQREEQRQAAMESVQNLQLQSIIYGENSRACMVNNALFQEGQQVDGFTVEKISPDAVIVRSGPYRFELKMQRPERSPLRR